jgi:hypothetical protein
MIAEERQLELGPRLKRRTDFISPRKKSSHGLGPIPRVLLGIHFVARLAGHSSTSPAVKNSHPPSVLPCPYCWRLVRFDPGAGTLG